MTDRETKKTDRAALVADRETEKTDRAALVADRQRNRQKRARAVRAADCGSVFRLLGPSSLSLSRLLR